MSDAQRIRRQRARLRRERSEAIRSTTELVSERERHQARERNRFALPDAPAIGPGTGWDHTADQISATPPRNAGPSAPLTAELLALFAEPGVYTITPRVGADTLERPLPDIENALEALVAAGELVRAEGHVARYHVSEARKAQLEHMFTEAAHEVGETQALARYRPHGVAVFEDSEEPRLPVTAGLLSLFLPGTGQLLNGDVGRASLVFAVWSLALLIHLPAIWTFVALYAGAEAFFTAKVRGIERRLELEAPREPEPSEG